MNEYFNEFFSFTDSVAFKIHKKIAMVTHKNYLKLLISNSN